jgi:hypothetical protein
MSSPESEEPFGGPRYRKQDEQYEDALGAPPPGFSGSEPGIELLIHPVACFRGQGC